MINEDKIKKLVDMGATRWSKGGRNRLYLNRAYKELLDMKVSRYNSGNISNATIGGEDIERHIGYFDIDTGIRSDAKFIIDIKSRI